MQALVNRVAGFVLNTFADTCGMGYTGVSRRISAIAGRRETDTPMSKRIRDIVDGNVKT